MAVPKRLKSIVALAEEHGWTYSETGGKHPMLTPPNGTVDDRTGRNMGPVTFALTPSDPRGDRNAIAQLRRAGVPVPHKGHTEKKNKKERP